MIRISAIEPSMIVVTASRVNDTSSPGALGDARAERLERGLALLGDLDVDAVVVQPGLEVGQLGVGVVDDARARCWRSAAT